MITRLRAWDDALIERLQDLYLWLWDRTGIYLGTCMAALALLTPLIKHLDGVEMVYLGVNLAFCAVVRLWQQRKHLAAMNASARAYRDATLRRPMIVAWIAITVFNPDPIVGVAYLPAALSAFYLFCIQVRDRQPKDLFAAWRQPALAGGAA